MYFLVEHKLNRNQHVFLCLQTLQDKSTTKIDKLYKKFGLPAKKNLIVYFILLKIFIAAIWIEGIHLFK